MVVVSQLEGKFRKSDVFLGDIVGGCDLGAVDDAGR